MPHIAMAAAQIVIMIFIFVSSLFDFLLR
ncbi:hypothetical protein SBA4_3660014 [Candidatus Sulfopaludibacter sp. SbA4]|nr:hypothetical protein SBA4_3660014 [Candidatus Sulfopaludibacter sp. SbA4]